MNLQTQPDETHKHYISKIAHQRITAGSNYDQVCCGMTLDTYLHCKDLRSEQWILLPCACLGMAIMELMSRCFVLKQQGNVSGNALRQRRSYHFRKHVSLFPDSFLRLLHTGHGMAWPAILKLLRAVIIMWACNYLMTGLTSENQLLLSNLVEKC